MTFRLRLGLAFGLAALVPVILLGAGVRSEMTRRATAQADRRVSALTTTIAADLAARTTALRGRLTELGREAAGDNAIRLVLEGRNGDRRVLLDWAGRAMRTAGLEMLQLQDSTGRIVSSGHFRNEYDRRDSALPAALRRDGTPALALARGPEGPFLALAALDSLTLGGAPYTLIGGALVDSGRIAGLAPEGDLGVTLVAGRADCGTESVGPLVPGIPLFPCAPPHVVSEIRLPLATDTGAAQARLVITRDPAAIRSLERAVDRWVIGAAGLALALAVAVGVVLAAGVSRPLAQLAEKTRTVDLDRLDQTFSTGRTDELGALEDLLDAMSRRLRASTSRLREAERRAATGDLARQVNHDVKNGLVPIRNVLRHLSATADQKPEELALVFGERRGTLDASIAYLEELARNYARLAPAPEAASCDGAALVREVARAIVRPDLDVQLHAEPGLPAVGGDRVTVRRILENLAANAVDALGGRPGRVSLTVEPAGTASAPAVRFVVADTGPGLSREELDRVFEDFYTTKPGGTGLGLSVVRRLVGDLGGALKVETAPGQGSRFIVELPAA